MTLGSWLRLVGQNLRRARRQFILSTVGITIGISSLSFFLALAGGVRKVVLGRVFRVDRVEIEPSRSGLEGPLSFLGGGPRPLDDAQVARLAAVPGVRAVWPRMKLGFPAKAWGGAEFFGSNRYFEVIGEGLEPAALTGDGAKGIGPLPFADLETGGSGQTCNADPDCQTAGEYCAWDVHQCQRPVPLVISRFLLELYNSTFAPSHHLPRIGDFLASRFRGFTFTVELGTSFMGPQASRGTPRQRRVMLVGVSDRAVPIGISFPLPYVKRWNAEYGGAAAATGYSSLTVEVADRGAVTRVAQEARSLGLQVVDSGAEQAGLAITLITLLFALVSLAIVAVALLNIAHTFFRAVSERRREIGVLRALGATAADVRRLLLGEAAAIGLCGGLAGVLLAWLASLAIDFVARCPADARRCLVPAFPFKPDTFFEFSWLLVGGVVTFALVTCLVGAFWPARAASRLEPAAALAS